MCISTYGPAPYPGGAVPFQRLVPLTTKSASRAPHSVQRNSRAQSGTGIPEPCCATWVAMSGSAHSSFENPLRGYNDRSHSGEHYGDNDFRQAPRPEPGGRGGTRNGCRRGAEHRLCATPRRRGWNQHRCCSRPRPGCFRAWQCCRRGAVWLSVWLRLRVLPAGGLLSTRTGLLCTAELLGSVLPALLRLLSRGFLEKRSPLATAGFSFLTLALSALSLVSGAVADSGGTLPHDGAVDRDCELARHVRFDRSHHR